MSFDYLKLKARLVEKDKKISDLAELLGISRQAVYERLNSNVPFKDYEIVKISNFLGIEGKDIDEYFFKIKVHIN